MWDMSCMPVKGEGVRLIVGKFFGWRVLKRILLVRVLSLPMKGGVYEMVKLGPGQTLTLLWRWRGIIGLHHWMPMLMWILLERVFMRWSNQV